MKLLKDRNIRRDEYADIDAYLSEAVGVGLTSVVIFLAVAIFSYHPHDSTMFFFDSEFYFVKNMGGLVGAHLSAMLFHILGAGTYVFWGVLTIISYMLLLGYRHAKSLWGLLALPFCVISASLISSLYGVDFVYDLPGGVLGYALNGFLTSYIGFYGAAIFGWVTLWVSSVIVLRMSFIRGLIAAYRYLASSRIRFFFSR